LTRRRRRRLQKRRRERASRVVVVVVRHIEELYPDLFSNSFFFFIDRFLLLKVIKGH
jgi:hypothetical protein